MTPFVSVIIATRDRAHLLAQTLEALGRQTWPLDRLEVVVADNGSRDGTRAVVDGAGRIDRVVRYLHVPEAGKSRAVNAALGEARGDLIVFTDDDVLPHRAWIERLVASFDGSGVDFVAGRILPRWEAAPPRWLSRAVFGVLAVPDNGESPQLIGDTDSRVMPIGANMAVRAGVIARIGGLRTDLGKLDGTLRTGEDHEFFLRMLARGFRGRYEPTAVVHHWVPRNRLTTRYFRRWMYQNGRDVARLAGSYPSSTRRLLGLPRYLWRDAIVNAWRMVHRSAAADSAAAFAAALRIVWFAGYASETLHLRGRV